MTLAELLASRALVLTVQDVSSLLGVDDRTVRRAVDSGQILGHRIGRQILIPRIPFLEHMGFHVDPDNRETSFAVQTAAGDNYGGRPMRWAAEVAVAKYASTMASAAKEKNESSRRDRISDALLREVAAVYRQALADDRSPTQAVAKHFSKPRSTAGRWVALAREAGFLGRATGTRGGEEPQ